MIQIKITPSPINLRQPLSRAIDQALRQTADYVFDEAYRAADKHTKTGALIQSLKVEFSPGAARIFHDPQRAPHAAFLHDGTKPHIIRPKNRKALRWPSGGGFAFAKQVNHPGYKGDPYFARIKPTVPAIFKRFLEAAL